MSHDLFISYAWVDNEPEPGFSEGWVTQLVAGLERRLARNLGRRDVFNLWIDYEKLRGTDPLQEGIAKQLESSRFLLVFLSPGYVSSEWCRNELRRFSQLRDSKSRIVIVWVRNLPPDDIPAEIRDEQGCLDRLAYQFWYQDQGVEHTLGDPEPVPSDRRYRDLLDRLAAHLAEALRSTSKSVGEVVASESLEQPDESGEKPLKNVFVACGDGDEKLTDDVARMLRQEGFSVRIPMTALRGFNPGTALPQQIRDDFDRNLKAAETVVFVHHKAPIAQLRLNLNECILSPEHRFVPRLCQSSPDTYALGYPDEDLKVFVIGEDCPENCARQVAVDLRDGGDDA